MALKISDLSFSFFNHPIPFFEKLSLSFAKGRLHFIRGKNGAGKSTLFRIIGGTVYTGESANGTITINKKSYRLSQSDDRNRLGQKVRLVCQKFDEMLADQFTFIQNLQLAGMPEYPSLETFSDEYHLPALIERFGINFDVPVGLLSGGQRQILAILMALQKSTKILLLDEPTAALDDKNATMVMLFIQELLSVNTALTILIICHDRELVEHYAQDAYHSINVDDHGTRTIELVPHTKK